jgi:hypothetical protein
VTTTPENNGLNPFSSLAAQAANASPVGHSAPPDPAGTVKLKGSGPREWMLMSSFGARKPDGESFNPFGEPTTRAWLTQIEESTGFWDSTPQLQRIAHEAARMKVSPWGLLATCQEHQAANVPPCVVLVRKDGTRGSSLRSGMSLNGYVGLVAEPGGNKSATFILASELIPPPGSTPPDGTGQGIVKHLAVSETRTKDEENKPLPKPVELTVYKRWAIMIHAPEVKTLNAEFSRTGTKTDSFLRQLWVGETVGMLNSDKERKLIIHPNMVRVCGAWGVQPENADNILGQAKDGTPQRFTWAPVEEFRNPHPTRTAPPPGTTFPMPVFDSGAFGTSMPSEIELDNPVFPDPVWVEWSPQMHIDIAAFRAIMAEAKDRDPYAKRTDEEDEFEKALVMRAHLILVTIKEAVKMGWLHGRANPSDGDWELAKIQMEVSTAELAGVWQECERANREAAKQRGRERFEEDAGRQEAAVTAVDPVAEIVVKIIGRYNGEPVTRRQIKDGIGSRKDYRALMNPAIKAAEADGRIAEVAGPRGGRCFVLAVPSGGTR